MVPADLHRAQNVLLQRQRPATPVLPGLEEVQGAIEPAGEGFTLRRGDRLLHSRYDPIKEARRLAEEIEIERPDQLVCFFGAGLGYSLRLFRDRHSNPCLWFEPDLFILSAALAVCDFRTELLDESIRVIPALPAEDELASLFRGRGNRQIVFVTHRGSLGVADPYRRAREICETFLNKKDVNLATMARFDRDWSRNLIANFYNLARARPVSALFGSLPGAAALVCGAGPSLGESLGAIARHRDRFTLIAVDTALHVLTGAGIDPDIIVSVDPQPINRYYLEGYTGRALFVVDPTTSYLSLRMLAVDRLYYTASPFALAKWFFSFLDGPPGEIAFGGSVATNAYDLAIKLGCATVLLAGIDLSFTDGLAHARGAVLEERLNFRESRLFRRELHNHRQLSALPVRHLPGLDGQPVATNDKLVIFFRWMDNRIRLDAKAGIRVLNMTARGARFGGLDRADLEDWARAADPAPPAAANAAASRESAQPPVFRITEFYDSIREKLNELAELETPLREGAELAERILQMAMERKHDEQYRRLLRKMDRLDRVVREKIELSNFIGEAVQRIIFQITEGFGGLLDAEDLADEHRETARKSRLLYAGLLEACRDYRRWLGHALRLYAGE